MAGGVADGDSEHVIAGEQFGDRAVGGLRADDRVVAHATAQLLARRLAQQPLEVGRAEELAGRCLERREADEHLGGDAHHPVGLADLRQRVGDGRRRAEDDQLRRHHPACRGRFVGEQLADDIGVLDVHRLEDPGALVAGHLAEEVDEVVVLHLLEDADQPIEVERFDEAQLFVLGELLEQVGEAFVVHRRGELAAPRQRHRPHDRGDFGRVQVAEPGGFGVGLGRRREQPGDLVDVDEPVARAPAEHVAADEADLGDLPRRSARQIDVAQGDVAHRSRRRSCDRGSS